MEEEFHSGRFAATLTRVTERPSLDSLAVDQVLAGVREMKHHVGRWGVYERVLSKIARAVVERDISPVRVGEIIETLIVRLRMQREQNLPEDHDDYITNPGAYFVEAVKAEFVNAGIEWKRPKTRY